MNAILCHPQQPARVQRSTTQERSQFWGGFVGALVLVVIEFSPLALWLLWLGTGAPLDRLPTFVQMLAIVGSFYCLTTLAAIFLALLESRQFFGIGMLVGMAVGIVIGAGYSASLFLLLVINTCHTSGASCT
jgi:hypothetical protein